MEYNPDKLKPKVNKIKCHCSTESSFDKVEGTENTYKCNKCGRKVKFETDPNWGGE